MTDQAKRGVGTQLVTIHVGANNWLADLPEDKGMIRLISMLMHRDSIHLLEAVFLQTYNDSYQTWLLDRWCVNDGTYAKESAEAQRFLNSYPTLLAAFKAEIHKLVDSL